MGKETGIAWANSTFNPWLGCAKISEACDRCYAETMVTGRMGKPNWGKDAPRTRTSVSYWKQPFKWDKDAAAAGIKSRVFCGSLCDIAEDRSDLDPIRADLWPIMEQTKNLIYLMLTKRPALLTKIVPPSWLKNWPENVWPGTTAENQFWYDHRRPLLMKVPSRIHWFSLEPLLGPINLRFDNNEGSADWFIVGGESGKGSRPMEAEWIRSIRSQVETHGKAFFFKQKGEILAKTMGCTARKGDDPSEWPEEFRVQNFPQVA
jgi:protein gp37